MKIITKSVISMATGKVEYEESYDYNGPIAQCLGGGSSHKTSYAQSPEQRQIFGSVSPIVNLLSNYALGNAGYGAPSQTIAPVAQPFAPQQGSYSRTFHPTRSDYEAGYSKSNPPPEWSAMYATPAPATTSPTSPNIGSVNQLYDIPNMPSMYDLPSTSQLMPQQGWFNNLDPSVTAGLWEPWNQASKQMLEQMGSRGQLGSITGGYSGTSGVALGDLYSKAGQNVGLQAWNMVSPAYQAGYNAELARNVLGYQGDLQRRAEQLQQYQMPYQILPGLLGGSYPTNVVQPAGPSTAGAISGGLAGALGGFKASGGNPWGAAIGAGAGLLGGK